MIPENVISERCPSGCGTGVQNRLESKQELDPISSQPSRWHDETATAKQDRQEPIRLSVILPVIDETESLIETVRILEKENAKSIEQILIIVCKITTPEALRVCELLRNDFPQLIEVRSQHRPYLGGAMQDAFEWATGSHVLMMASDLRNRSRHC